MRNNIHRLLFVVMLFLVPLAYAGMPPMPEIPERLPDAIRQPLIAKRHPLAIKKQALLDEGDSNKKKCTNVVVGSAQHRTCLEMQKDFYARVEALSVEFDILADEIDAAVNKHTIKSMNAMAKRLGWSVKEQARLNKALNCLDLAVGCACADNEGSNKALNCLDAVPLPDLSTEQINNTWQDIIARGQDRDLMREASQSDGPGFPGAGTQSFEDCTIFALANAAGLPYGVVASRATKLISEGEWRDASDRANPQKVIEQKGLIGGEVVMLAESFGQVEVVPGTNFAKTLKEGRPVMVNVVPENGNFDNGHQVVLTKAFQHGGETWYEMVDSNQGPQERRYLSAKELGTIQQENGVAYRPEKGTVPKLLR